MAKYLKRATGGAIYLIWNHTGRRVRGPGRLLEPSQAALSHRLRPTAEEGVSRLVVSTDRRCDQWLDIARKGLVMMAEVVTDNVLHIPFNTRVYPFRVLSPADIDAIVAARAEPPAVEDVDTNPNTPDIPPAPKKGEAVTNPNTQDVPPVPAQKAKDFIESAIPDGVPPLKGTGVVAAAPVDGPEGGIEVEFEHIETVEHLNSEQVDSSSSEEVPVVDEGAVAANIDVETDDDQSGPPTADDDSATTIANQEVFDKIPWDSLGSKSRADLRKYGQAFDPAITGLAKAGIITDLEAARAAVTSD